MYTNNTNHTNKTRASFTLIELLVVLALVAILSVVVILTLNPAELLKQAKDSNRLSDLATVNTALNLFSSDVINGFMGTSTIVYVSIPDNASSTCGSLGLPTLPSGWTYNCVTSQNLRKTDGTGWIPVNFQRISSNSPISQLPIDPINTTSTRLYYTYVSDGSWELNAAVEASKNKLGGSGDLVSKDGGSATSLYEIGNNLNLNPVETGDLSLVGYWKFDETSGTVARDSSGNGNDGTYIAVTLNQPGASSQTSNSVIVNASTPSARITIPAMGFLPMTIVGLHKRDDAVQGGSYRDLFSASANVHHFISESDTYRFGAWNGAMFASATTEPNDGLWHQYAMVYNSANSQNLYFDGNFLINFNANLDPATNKVVNLGNWNSGYNAGPIDDFRIYNRALSAAEISALYNATK